MRKVYDHRIYDTETAKKLAEYQPNPDYNDLYWYCETLYQKRTGEFFLHGEGNAGSPYSRSVSRNNWSGGEKIKPLTYAEAQKWAEKCLDGDEYIAIFGKPEEDNSKVMLSAYIPKSLLEQIKQKSAQDGKTISEQVSELLMSAIDK